MPNGRRRGGAYRRGGKTYHRKGAKIAKGKGPYIAGAAIGAAVFAAPLLSNPVVLGVGFAAVLGVVAWRHRHWLRKASPYVRRSGWRKLAGNFGVEWEDGKGWFVGVLGGQRYRKQGRVMPVYATPKPSRAVRKSGAYLDSNLAPHRADGKHMPIPEWESLYYDNVPDENDARDRQDANRAATEDTYR